MNKLQRMAFLVVMVLVLASAGLVNAQAPQGTPPTPQMIAEINATRGAALLKFSPQYAAYMVPVTSGAPAALHSHAPNLERIAEINGTRGAALLAGR